MTRYRCNCWSMAFILAIAVTSTATPVCARSVDFSGATWTVKVSTGKAGPGPNYFSDSDRNVWVDADGRLHLKITHNENRWECAEVIHTGSLGYGTYRFCLDSPVANFDPNVVFGLFTWNDEPAYSHREIDIELSRWSKPDNLNAQYVVQPFNRPEHRVRFSQPPGMDQTTHQFRWQTDSILFQTLRGVSTAPSDPKTIIHEWKATEGIPVPGGENARINLWLYRGRGPADGHEVEVIVRRFEFMPGP